MDMHMDIVVFFKRSTYYLFAGLFDEHGYVRKCSFSTNVNETCFKKQTQKSTTNKKKPEKHFDSIGPNQMFICSNRYTDTQKYKTYIVWENFIYYVFIYFPYSALPIEAWTTRQ